MPNLKTDVNNNFAFSTDYIGKNYEYPEADYPRREQILQDHEYYQQGLMWTLANHPRVPESIRQIFQNNGLAKDEFLDNGHWPRQLYVREARRLVSDYVMTEKNCKRLEVVHDSVGMGAYNMDSHNTQRYVTSEGLARNEGDVQIPTKAPRNWPAWPSTISNRSKTYPTRLSNRGCKKLARFSISSDLDDAYSQERLATISFSFVAISWQF
jgi:hypothetical protein